jgi:C1A family cysteine protease
MPLRLSPAGRRYGYLKDRADHRDFGIASSPVLLTSLPASFDLESYCGAVRDQGDEGSCTAHAGVGMREFLARKYMPPSAPVLSPAFLYYVERQLDGSLDQGDCGSFGRTAMRAMNQFGICTLADEPYVPGDFSTPPTEAQLLDALTYKAGAYHRIQNVEDMKSCIASGYAFAIGFTVYESFENVGSDGLWSPDKNAEQILGGHEVLAIGYDDSVNGGSFKVRNSWSASWGASGNFWLRYSDAGDPDVLQDAWLAHLGKAWQ